ncbi:MAG: hypothetical protein WBV40_05530 [Candidatus Cybelea sp.]
MKPWHSPLEAFVKYEASYTGKYCKADVNCDGPDNTPCARANTIADDLHQHLGGGEGCPELNPRGPANPHDAYGNRQRENIQADRECYAEYLRRYGQCHLRIVQINHQSRMVGEAV